MDVVESGLGNDLWRHELESSHLWWEWLSNTCVEHICS